MKSSIIFLFLFFSFVTIISLQAQVKDVSAKFSFLYQEETNTRYRGSYPEGAVYDVTKWQIGRPTISLGLLSKNDKHMEFEFWPLYLDVYDDVMTDTTDGITMAVSGGKSSNASGIFRYSYSILSFAKENRLFVPYLQISGGFYYSYYSSNPYQTLIYPYDNLEFSIAPAIIPGLQLNISERLFLNVDVPAEFLDISYNRSHVDNPTLENRLRTTSTISVETFKRWNIRFGMGIRI